MRPDCQNKGKVVMLVEIPGTDQDGGFDCIDFETTGLLKCYSAWFEVSEEPALVIVGNLLRNTAQRTDSEILVHYPGELAAAVGLHLQQSSHVSWFAVCRTRDLPNDVSVDSPRS